ncbi:hypothetical protein M513_05519 [Trichuris suis]|uniref:Uncharacterized protein n=1 Tax=Trichuris suis TaxID=68888 RepID=A0A085M8Q7_9BILA|nr:hypothetical protein M513_05519 [Trichuris suis]
MPLFGLVEMSLPDIDSAIVLKEGMKAYMSAMESRVLGHCLHKRGLEAYISIENYTQFQMESPMHSNEKLRYVE